MKTKIRNAEVTLGCGNQEETIGTEVLNARTFNFMGTDIRVIVKDDDSWFVASDVCDALNLQNPSKSLSPLDDDERSNFKLGRQGEVNIISEAGLYTLIMRSRKPQAKPFRRWVTHEVLPAINRQGVYAASPANLDALVTSLTETVTANVMRNLAQTSPPLLGAGDRELPAAKWTVQATAERLTNHGIPISTASLYLWLVDHRWVEKKTKSRRYAPGAYGELFGYIAAETVFEFISRNKKYTQKRALITERGYLELVNLLSSKDALVPYMKPSKKAEA